MTNVDDITQQWFDGRITESEMNELVQARKDRDREIEEPLERTRISRRDIRHMFGEMPEQRKVGL